MWKASPPMPGSFWGRWKSRTWMRSTGLSPGHLDRPENHLQKPALHCGHRYRDLRLPAPALCAHRRAALPGLRAGDHASRRSTRWWTRCWSCRRAPRFRCWPRWSAGKKGEHQSRSLRRAAQVRLCPGAGGRQPVRADRGDQAGKEQKAQHRDCGRPPGGRGGDPVPPDRLAGNRHRPDRRSGAGGCGGRGGDALLPELRLPGARHQHRGAQPPDVLLQQPVRCLSKSAPVWEPL